MRGHFFSVSWHCLGPSWQWIKETGCSFFLWIWGFCTVVDHSPNTSNNLPAYHLHWPLQQFTVIISLHFKSSDVIQSCFLDILKRVTCFEISPLLKKELNLSFWPWCVLNVENGLNMQQMSLFRMVPLLFKTWNPVWVFVLPHVETLAALSSLSCLFSVKNQYLYLSSAFEMFIFCFTCSVQAVFCSALKQQCKDNSFDLKGCFHIDTVNEYWYRFRQFNVVQLNAS